MGSGSIIALITAALVAIPTIWAWKQHRDAKKLKETLDKEKADIHDAIAAGDTKRIADIVDKLLRR